VPDRDAGERLATFTDEQRVLSWRVGIPSPKD
jgi:hypothetical protein